MPQIAFAVALGILSGAILVLGGILFAFWRILTAHDAELARLRTRSEHAETALGTLEPAAELASRVRVLEDAQDDVMLAVAEGIKNVERAENRIRATVSRARKQLEDSGVEHAGLEAEAAELRLIDGGGGSPEGLPPMPADMGATPSSIPGVSLTELQRARGMI